MLTVQILTKNNAETIRKTLDCVSNLKANIVVGDYSSTDDTVSICKEYGAKVVSVSRMDRSKARMHLSEDGFNFWIEPWETILTNPSELLKFSGDSGYLRVLKNDSIYWDTRLWKGKKKFVNPIYEALEEDGKTDLTTILRSNGSLDDDLCLKSIEDWITNEPLSSKPHYYHSCLLLSNGNYDGFLRSANHYLFLEKKNSMSSVMTRYYCAMVYTVVKKEFKPALQNLNFCLCSKPLMAEFWCLIGDVYYHLLDKYEMAIEFYENAMILGSRRLANDKWPMEISKYKKYPEKMIDNCYKIIYAKSKTNQDDSQQQ